MAIYARPYTPDEIFHYGIKGQRWGVRRYQNADGTLTSAGKQHYSSESSGSKNTSNQGSGKSSGEKRSLSDDQKKAIKTGAAVTAAALAVVGTAYLVKSGKGASVVKAGKQITEKTISNGKKTVDKVLSKTTHGKFMKMSEKELDAYINRMNKVKKSIDNYYNVEHPIKGRTKKVLTKTAETASTGAAAYLVGSTIDKRLNKEQLGDYMRRGGAKKK